MSKRSEKAEFEGHGGHTLAAKVDLPEGPVQAWAVFAHCFTCTKDIKGAKRLASRLTRHGIGVLRFDFTGIGLSEGDFENTNFTTNVHDLVAAAEWLRANHEAPQLMIGHSLGGAAVLAAASEVPECKAVATIAAPSDPAHLISHFPKAVDQIEAEGSAEIHVGGESFTITREFVEDINAQNLEKAIAELDRALLVLHSPYDETMPIEQAERIFIAAKHPKSFVSLDDADHLMHGEGEAAYAADVIAAWASKFIDADLHTDGADRLKGTPGEVWVRETGRSAYQQDIAVSDTHFLRADEPEDVGGTDSGPSPYDLLLAGLGACTSMTLRMYAERKQIPLERVTVRLKHDKIHAEDCADCKTKDGKLDRIERSIEMEGELDADTRKRLLEIADKCPVHRTLHSEINIVTREDGA